MRKLNELNKNERNMLIVLVVLIIFTIVNWQRIYAGIEVGFGKFFGSPVKHEQVK